MRAGGLETTIEHDLASMGCFAEDHFEMRKMIKYFSGTLSYSNCDGDKVMKCRYEKGLMPVSEEESQVCALQISDDVKDTSRKSYPAWIARVSFHALCNINDSWGFDRDWNPRTVGKADRREENKGFLQTTIQESRSRLKRRNIMCDRTLQKVEGGEELFADKWYLFQFVPSRQAEVT